MFGNTGGERHGHKQYSKISVWGTQRDDLIMDTLDFQMEYLLGR
jgi:hypothetical protein